MHFNVAFWNRLSKFNLTRLNTIYTYIHTIFSVHSKIENLCSLENNVTLCTYDKQQKNLMTLVMIKKKSKLLTSESITSTQKRQPSSKCVKTNVISSPTLRAVRALRLHVTLNMFSASVKLSGNPHCLSEYSSTGGFSSNGKFVSSFWKNW